MIETQTEAAYSVRESENGCDTLPITVQNRIAVYNSKEKLICGNSSYLIQFNFDSEWNAYPIKTAQFRYLDESGSFVHHHVVFEGSSCSVPVISHAETVYVGVFAGSLRTSTEASIPCWPSALSYTSPPELTDDNVYHTIMEKLNAFELLGGDKVTPQMFGAAGDGVTDDTAAFLALDGKNAYIPEGIYCVSKCVFHQNTVLRGAGVGKTIIQQLPDGNSDLFVFEDASSSCLTDLSLHGAVKDGQEAESSDAPFALLKIVSTSHARDQHAVFHNLALRYGPSVGLMLVGSGESAWDTDYRERSVQNPTPYLSRFTISQCGGWGMVDESCGNLFSDFIISDNGSGGLLLSHADSNLYSGFKISGSAAAAEGSPHDALVTVRHCNGLRMLNLDISSTLGTGMDILNSSAILADGWIRRVGTTEASENELALNLTDTAFSELQMTLCHGDEPYKRNVRIGSSCVDSIVWINDSADIPNENQCPDSCMIASKTAPFHKMNELSHGMRDCMNALSEAVRFTPMELTEQERQTARDNLDAASAIVVDASGETIALSDASDGRLRGLRVFGKTTQAVTTGAQLAEFPDKTEVIENGIRWICKDGVIGVSGTASGLAESKSSAVGIWADIPIEAGTYYISGSTDDVLVYAEIEKADGTYSIKDESSFTLDGTEVMCAVYCKVHSPSAVAEFIRPMLNKGTEPEPWEPYTGGVRAPNPDYPMGLSSVGGNGELTVSVNDQTLSVSTPNGLPGIPVTSGGNYTDSDGQQWVCDEIDFQRGVYVQRIGRKTLDGAEAFVPNGEDGKTHSFFVTLSSMGLPGAKAYAECSCSFLEGSPRGADNLQNNTASFSGGSLWIYSKRFLSTDEVEIYLKNSAAAGTPEEFMYQLAEPVETALSEEQLAAFRAIYTSKPETTVTSDEGAWLSVKYAADPKAYVDNKFNELAKIIISNT